MILIDTDHATLLKYPESERGGRFIARLDTVPATETIGVGIVSEAFLGEHGQPRSFSLSGHAGEEC